MGRLRLVCVKLWQQLLEQKQSHTALLYSGVMETQTLRQGCIPTTIAQFKEDSLRITSAIQNGHFLLQTVLQLHVNRINLLPPSFLTFSRSIYQVVVDL